MSPYTPMDATPPELQPAGLADPAPWIIDTHASPTHITDWPARQAAALIPFDLDAHGWPVNPAGRTGRIGRDLPRWGENQAADPIVIAGSGTERSVLLIRRSDNGRWALPGGMVDPGEGAPAALVRELFEETGVDLSGRVPDAVLYRGYVADWRATDHAWVCSTAALYELPDIVPVQAADDAVDARWVRFANLDQLAEELADVGGLYAAHRPLLAAV